MSSLVRGAPRHTAVAAAIDAVGTHRAVRLEVTGVAVYGLSVEIDLVIHYPRATPVCCGEPGCYLGFLGRHRALLPKAIGHALGMASPLLTVRAQLRHEPGYRYVDVRTGEPTDEGVDFLATYRPEDFGQ